MQESLIDADADVDADVEVAAASEAVTRAQRGAMAPEPRATSKSIGAGDIVLIDKKGRRFHALVTELEQTGTGRFELGVRPLDSRISYRTATVREVIGVWRKARRG